MKNLLLTLMGVSVFLIFGCSEKSSNQVNGAVSTDSISSSFHTEDLNSLENRSYIKTSELVCKVKDVQKTTNEVAELVNQMGGLVLHSAVKNNIVRTKETEISSDSILVAQYFETSNELTLRIPNTNFENILKAIKPMIGFVETFNIDANDVSLNLLENNLNQKRFKEFENDIKPKTKKFKDVNSVYETKNEADRNKIANLKMKDAVNFSTITLHLKQPMGIYKETKPNIDNTRLNKPVFFVRIFNSLKQGTYIIEEVVVFLSKFWLLVLVGFFVFRIYKKHINSKI